MDPDSKAENPTEGMSFIEKQKYFEREIQHQASGAPRQPAKQFSYLSEHEVARMKQYEEQKASNMSHEELLEYMSPYQETEYNQVLASLDISKTSPTVGTIRTLKAEKRLSSQKNSTDTTASAGEGEDLTSDERAQEAEKRAAWRKARMKSLEADALKAKAVIEKANELSQNVSQPPKHHTATNPLSTLDIAFADADSAEESVGTQNGNSDHMSSSASAAESLTDAVIRRGQLSVHKDNGDTTVRRSTHMIDQKVSEITEEVFDETLGKPVLKTFRITEKTLEHEVEVTKQQIYKLKLTDGQCIQAEQH